MGKIILTRYFKHKNSVYQLIFILSFLCGSVYSQVEVPLQKRTALTLRGDFKFVSNAILGKVSNDNGSGIFNPNKSYNNGGLNNQFQMGFIDIDTDDTTFNSSSADLDIDSSCGAIKHVGLYWTASYADQNRVHDITTLKIKFPSHPTYTDIQDATVIHDYYKDERSVFKQYSCYKDITPLVMGLDNPFGTYTVANIPATISAVNDDEKLGNGLAGGWTMIVIYEDDTQQRKRFYVYDGYVNIDSKAKPVVFSFDNFKTIPKGSVRGKIGVIAYEGDKGIRGDRFEVFSNEANKFRSITDGSNPMNNFFNANITENGKDVRNRVPASYNTLGYDADLFDIKNANNRIIGNKQSEAKFRLSTANDGYSAMAVAFSVEIYEPSIHIIKQSYRKDHSVIMPNEVLRPEEEITYTLLVRNDGNDNAQQTIIKDVLPKNVSFLEESLVLPSKKIKYKYDEKSRVLRFFVPNKMVKMDSESFEITYNIKVDPSDVLMQNNKAAVVVVDEIVTAEFNGTLTDNRRVTKGYNHFNKCDIPDFYQFKLAVDIKQSFTPTTIAGISNKRLKRSFDRNNFEENEYYKRSSNTPNAGTGLQTNDVTTVDTGDNTSITTIDEIPKSTINDLINLNEIYFEFDKWDITPKGADELDKIVMLMQNDHPEMVIKIETHSDSRGNHEYNLDLSQKRAEAIYSYLIDQNISKYRIVSRVGFGESKPVNNCKDGEDCSEEEYQINRRSNFVIM